MVSTDKGLQLFHSRMVGCHLLSWRNLQKKIAFFRLFSSERSETCDTPKGIYFSELKNLGGGSGTRRVHMPRAYIFLVFIFRYVWNKKVERRFGIDALFAELLRVIGRRQGPIVK